MLAIFKTPRSGRIDNRDSKQQAGNVNNRSGYPPNSTQQVPPQRQQPDPGPRTPIQGPSSNTTIIGKGLVFNGEVNGEGSVRVEGKFVGTLDIGHEVIIGDGGNIEGNIRAKSVSVLGTLRGNVVALDKITIDITGAMYGDIVAPRVVVTEGAVYKGRIDMEPKTLKSQGGDKAKASQKNTPVKETEKKPDGPKDKIDKTIPGPPPKA